MKRLNLCKSMITRVVFLFIGLQIGAQNTFVWTAKDANGNWSFPVPHGWYGGSYYQIMERVNDAEQKGKGDALHIQILRGLSRDARYLDAVLINIETPTDGTHGDASFLKINTNPTISSSEDGFPTISQLTTELWTKVGLRILGSTSGAVDIKLLNHQEDLSIRGYQAAAVNFKIVMKSGQDNRYEGTVIIYRASSTTTFNLNTPWHINKQRWDEMWKMLKVIQFSNSGDKEHIEDLKQDEAIKYLAWKLGSKVSLVAIGYEAGLPRNKAIEMIDKVKDTADYFDVQIPTLPYKSGSRAEFAAVILHYLLDDFGGKIGGKLAADYRTEIKYLFEIAIKSNILLLLYGPGEDMSKAISDVIKHRAPRAGIPDSAWRPLVRKIENGASYDEVKKAVVKFQNIVEKSLTNF